MTYASLINLLRTVIPEFYDTAAPAGLTRFGVAAVYGAESHYGDDANVLDFPRVQIDLYFQDPADSLPGDVCETLRAWSWPYSVQDRVWDDDRALFRVILQTEVLSLV